MTKSLGRKKTKKLNVWITIRLKDRNKKDQKSSFEINSQNLWRCASQVNDTIWKKSVEKIVTKSVESVESVEAYIWHGLVLEMLVHLKTAFLQFLMDYYYQELFIFWSHLNLHHFLQHQNKNSSFRISIEI